METNTESMDIGNLWEQVQLEARRETPDKLSAVKKLWEKHRELPEEESIKLVIELAGEKQPIEVRRAILEKLATYNVPWDLFLGAFGTLQDDSDPRIQELVKKSLPHGWATEKQRHELRRQSRAIEANLVLWSVASAGFSVFSLFEALRQASQSSYVLWVVLLCVAAGTLGSSISALISVAERVANGWELERGEKWPPVGGKPDKFVARMIPLFLVRPLLGSAMGYLVYVGIVGGFLVAVRTATPGDFRPEGLAFLALLAGLFAKTFLEKLRDAFKTFLGA